MATPKQTDPQFKLRMPLLLKAQIDASAAANNRSMNAEIVDRLEQSYESWPRVYVPASVREMARAAGAERRQLYDERLNDAALEIALSVFPRGDRNMVGFITAYNELIYDAPEDKRDELVNMLTALLEQTVTVLDDDAKYTLSEYKAAVEMERGLIAEGDLAD